VRQPPVSRSACPSSRPPRTRFSPTRPIAFAGIAPGGTLDIMVPLYAQELATVLGTSAGAPNPDATFIS